MRRRYLGTKEETVDPNLWVWVMDKYHHRAAVAIAIFHSQLKEGSLEWIQGDVKPSR